MARPVINECYSPTSLKSRLKSSFRCFPNTEMIDQHEILRQDYGQEGGDCMKLQPRTPRSLYAWLKSTVHDLEFKEKYRCSIGKRGKNRKRHCSEDFRLRRWPVLDTFNLVLQEFLLTGFTSDQSDA
ncbi:hypothetical protein OIU74_025308 [Salix koriyanagi]|uniref:Uncharacterized protein n=1 Tax=Salix koriyanagi TaxID=2511006 RepID=A0A9Q0W234_9ROSI|nr:hypothetical protein OIU74_025308 [Salix koriyanagi]